MPQITAPLIEEERPFVTIVTAFVGALQAGHRRRAKILVRHLARVARLLGRQRTDELAEWLLTQHEDWKSDRLR